MSSFYQGAEVDEGEPWLPEESEEGEESKEESKEESEDEEESEDAHPALMVAIELTPDVVYGISIFVLCALVAVYVATWP